MPYGAAQVLGGVAGAAVLLFIASGRTVIGAALAGLAYKAVLESTSFKRPVTGRADPVHV